MENAESITAIDDERVKKKILNGMPENLERRPIVMTMGVFDGFTLTAGHAWYLKEAKKFGSTLMVGVNIDESVTQLKIGRPILPYHSRARNVANIEEVDYVFPFDGKNVTAAEAIRPDVVLTSTTSGSFNDDENVTYREYVTSYGGEVVVAGKQIDVSTTGDLEKYFFAKPSFFHITFQEGQKSFPLHYNPNLCLPPDEATVQLSKIANNIIETQRCEEVLDLGTGSGIFTVSTLLNCNGKIPHFTVTDIDPIALNIANYNLYRAVAFKQAPPENISVLKRNWLDELSGHRKGKFDLVFCNPPYLENEAILPNTYNNTPRHTMFSEERGFSDYQLIFEQLAPLVREGGNCLIRTPRSQDKVVQILNILFQNIPGVEADVLKIENGAGLLIKF